MDNQILQHASIEGEWLTFAELAQRLGTSDSTARQRAYDQHWPRRKGPGGRIQVLPPEVVVAGVPALASPDKPEPVPPDLDERLLRLVAENAVLRDRNRQLTADVRTLMRMVMSREQELEALRNQPSGPA